MKFSMKEVVDIAIGIEESGYYFYTQCRSRFDNRELGDLLVFLATEELRHKEIFEKMLREIKDKEGLYSEDYYKYLKAIGDSRVFKDNSDVDRVVMGIKEIADVFKIAIAAEKDSILWYSELLAMYKKENEPLSVLTKLIDEERKHIIILLNLKEKMGLGNNQ